MRTKPLGVHGVGSGAGTRRPKCHQPFLFAVSGIFPAKEDLIVGKSNETMVGDGDAMGIVAEIAQHMFRAAEWSFGVNDPVMMEQQPKPGCEGSGLGEWDEMALEPELGLAEAVLSPATNFPRKTRLST